MKHKFTSLINKPVKFMMMEADLVIVSSLNYVLRDTWNIQSWHPCHIDLLSKNIPKFTILAILYSNPKFVNSGSQNNFNLTSIISGQIVLLRSLLESAAAPRRGSPPFQSLPASGLA